MTSTERQKETWTAIGTRISGDAKRCQAFLVPGREDPVLYAERAGYVIGGRYTVETSHRGDRLIRHSTPTYQGARAPEAERAVWEAESHAADYELERMAAARRHRGDEALGALLAPLEEVAAGLRTGAGRAGFIAYVAGRLNGAYYRAREERLRADAAEDGRIVAAALRDARRDASRAEQAAARAREKGGGS